MYCTKTCVRCQTHFLIPHPDLLHFDDLTGKVTYSMGHEISTIKGDSFEIQETI